MTLLYTQAQLPQVARPYKPATFIYDSGPGVLHVRSETRYIGGLPVMPSSGNLLVIGGAPHNTYKQISAGLNRWRLSIDELCLAVNSCAIPDIIKWVKLNDKFIANIHSDNSVVFGNKYDAVLYFKAGKISQALASKARGMGLFVDVVA